MAWWLWVLAGLGLLALEAATPGGFFAFFFGVGALLVGALAVLGWAGPPWAQWLMFSGFSVALLVVLRRPLARLMRGTGPQRPVDSLVGERGLLIEALDEGGEGRIEVRGSSWSARAPQAIAAGRHCVVERVEGLTLWVRPE